MNTENRNTDTRHHLTSIASPLYGEGVMIQVSDITKALNQQIKNDLAHLKDAKKRMTELRPKYLTYRDLEREVQAKEERVRRTALLLGDDTVESVRRAEKDDDGFDAYMVSDSPLALWEAMSSVLEHRPEMQIYELQHVLEQLGKKTSRQAIESAIVTHKELFSTRTRGRDRFVSLKR